MSDDDALDVRPITAADVAAVAEFLHRELNERLSADQWAAALQPAWASPDVDHGQMLVQGETVVGAYAAFYREREIDGATRLVCNLAAFCVRPDMRAHGLRLLRSMLRRREFDFTDFSPSGNVVELNKRLGFQVLDGGTRLIPNLPWPLTRARIIVDQEEIASRLSGRDREIFEDHRSSAAARHLLLVRGDRYCHVMFRRDRRKNLPVFASIIYLSDPAVFVAALRAASRHLLIAHRLPFMLIDERLAPGLVLPGHPLQHPRLKMIKSKTLAPAAVDYLYSELTEVAW